MGRKVFTFAIIPMLFISFVISFKCYVFEYRFNARYMLTGCRRPLMLNISGIGAWQQIITVVGYAVPLINVRFDKSI